MKKLIYILVLMLVSVGIVMAAHTFAPEEHTFAPKTFAETDTSALVNNSLTSANTASASASSTAYVLFKKSFPDLVDTCAETAGLGKYVSALKKSKCLREAFSNYNQR